MKILAFLIISSLWLIRLSNADQYRLRRIPLHPGRAPSQQPQIMKKWQMPAHMRQVPRPRPIPLHQHKKPIGPPRSAAVPLRAAQSIKIPQTWPTKNFVRAAPLPQDKPFLGSPKLPEYDFHVQTNQIAQHPNLIKQIDEKGPIHTIPAPNLSLADKPAHIEHNQHQTSVEIQKSHSYQVTESPDQFTKQFFRAQPPQQEVTKVHAQILNEPQEQQQQQDFYKLLNQQQPTDSYSFSIRQQQPLNQHQHIVQHQPPKAYSSQTRFFQPDASYITDVRNRDIQPQFHTFNYEEPAHKVSAEYRLVPDEKQQPQEQARSQLEPHFVRNYYDVNNVEGDSTANFGFNVPELKEELITGTFYSSLPNKQAADAFASLQEAGKQHSGEAETSKMRIYVPDENDGGQFYRNVDTTEEGVYDYDEASSPEEDVGETQHEEFGNRIKPKNY